jgi:hypothetical protein
MTNLEQRYSYAQQDLERQGKLAEEEVSMIAVKLSNTDLSIQSKVNAIEGLFKVQQFWSRKCDESGEGFDDGFLLLDSIYLKYEKDMVGYLMEWAKDDEYKWETIDELKEKYYDYEMYYYTEWDFYEEVRSENFYLELSTGDVVSWDEYLESHKEK